MQKCGFELLALMEMLVSGLSKTNKNVLPDHSFGSGHVPSVTIVMTPVRTLLVVSCNCKLEVDQNCSLPGTTCFQLLVCSAFAVVKVVIAVVLEDGL
jgi:hypothetical protein